MSNARVPATFAGKNGSTYRDDVLLEGTRVRSRLHPHLTGRIKHYEYNRPGVLSPVPYCIGWDDSPEAARLLGWFFVYASDDGVEPLTPADGLRGGNGRDERDAARNRAALPRRRMGRG